MFERQQLFSLQREMRNKHHLVLKVTLRRGVEFCLRHIPSTYASQICAFEEKLVIELCWGCCLKCAFSWYLPISDPFAFVDVSYVLSSSHVDGTI